MPFEQISNTQSVQTVSMATVLSLKVQWSKGVGTFQRCGCKSKNQCYMKGRQDHCSSSTTQWKLLGALGRARTLKTKCKNS